MNINDVKEIIRIVKENSINNLEIEIDNLKMSIDNKDKVYVNNQEILAENIIVSEKTKDTSDDTMYIVKSPLVGKVNINTNADTKNIFTVGDIVKKGDVLCSIEAMKLFNEVTSMKDGIISEILIKDNEIIEFDQLLFKIKSNKGDLDV